MTDKKDKLLEEMVFQHNKQIAELKAENEKLKSQFNNSFMLDWAKRQQNKKWEKILNDCCKANAELVEQIADLNAENEKLKKLLKDCILQKR